MKYYGSMIDDDDLVTKEYVDTGLGDKQDTLVSGTSIKTVNGNSLLGSGDIPISTTGGVTGVKGNSESSYRTGNVNITAANVGAVPTTRTVNSKALSGNITLSASDVSAVPTSRTVNSKALSSDITLSASDVSAVALADKYTRSSAGDIGWSNQTDGDAKVVAKSAIAFWNGAYSGTSSNLKYSSNGVIIGGSGFVRELSSANCSAGSIAAGNATSVTKTITKSGYFPIALCGSDTTLPAGFVIRKLRMTASQSGSCTCEAVYTNAKTSAQSVTTSNTVTFIIMWAKIT